MPIFSVCAAAACAAVRLKVTVVGLLSPRNCTAGNVLVAPPTPKVTGPQLLLRLSEGCRMLIVCPFKNSRGVPSQLPMRQIVATVLGSLVMVWVLNVVGLPAVTVALPVQTASSP